MKTTVEAHLTGMVRHLRAALLGCLLVAAVTIAMPASASAATVEMPGEWELVFNKEGTIIKGVAIISAEANGKGEFASESALFEKVVPGAFTGTLNGARTEASIKVTTQQYATVPATEFTSSNIQVQSSGTLSMSGSGTVVYSPGQPGSTSGSATVVATRIKTYKEVQERLAREKHEREEKELQERHEREEAELREEIRGEWSLTLKCGSHTGHGVARITQAASPHNEFSSSTTIFEGSIPGSFSGQLELSTAKVKITTQAAGSLPASTFTSSSMALATVVEGGKSELTMSGSGTFEAGGLSVPGTTLTATRVKNDAELVELEAKELIEREAVEKKAREAKEAQEAAEKAQREAHEKQQRETQEREAREKLEAQRKATEKTGVTTSGPTLSVTPLSKTLTVSSSGSLSLVLSNPNAWSVKGSIALTAPAGHAGKAHTSTKTSGRRKRHVPPLARASFTIGAHGNVTIKLTLSKAGRAELAHSKTLTVIATVHTQASTGGASASKTYKVTLRASTHKHRR
jgi:hypothetical protein